MSVNRYITRVLSLATSEDDQSTEVERMRQRMRAAGLLASEPREGKPRVSDEEMVALRRAASRGKSLSEIVLEDRG